MNPTRHSSRSILLQSVAGASRFVLFLASCVWLLVSPVAQAIVDANNNGLSDLWEKAHNDGNLFPGDFNPEGDPDGDGWTNAQEAAAGTDPSDANPPTGYLQPQITYHPTIFYTDPDTNITETESPATVTLNWPTLPGKLYILLYSTDLAQGTWSSLDEPRIGTGWEMGNGITLTQQDGSIADQIFWRVAVTDPVPAIDSDSDGLGDYEEYLAGTDPVISDSDGDTLSDYAEIVAGTNPHKADEDGDGLTDPFEIAAGTDSKNQETDGDAIPDYLDNQPLLSAQVFADADDDGIPDANDPDPNNPRGPKPLIISENASGNPQCELEMDESSSFILTVSNPAGPAPTASDITFYLNGSPPSSETASITALNDPPSAIGTQRFLLSWIAKVTTGYPAQTLQNISLRFKDAQDATTWLNVARVDVAEWEGMIAGVSCEGLNSGNFPIVDVISHYKGVKQSAQRLVYGNSIWYRGPKAIPLLDASGSNIGTTAQIGAERYPLFLISKSGSAYTVEQTLDISNPVAYPHHGKFYINRTAAAITMSPSTVGSIQIPARAIDQSPGIRFQPFPPAPETGTPNIGVLGTSFINGQQSTIYSGSWELLNASGNVRDFSSLEFTSVTYENGTTDVKNDGTGRLTAGIGATITPHSAGTLEHPGMPISLPDFPPAPYNNHASRTPLLPIQSEQWHKLVLKVGPDAGALSNGINLKLGTGAEGGSVPQTGFSLQVPTLSGFSPLTFPADGKIEMLPSSELYQKLVSPEGLTLFLKRDNTVNEFHRIGLDLIPKRSTYLVQNIAALDLPPLDLVPDADMAGVIGDVVKSAVQGSTIKHFVTPQKTIPDLPQEYVILRATGVTAEQIDDNSPKQIVKWDGGEEVEHEPLKRKVSRNAAKLHEVRIKVKQGGAVIAQMDVWVVWATCTPTKGAPLFVKNFGASQYSIKSNAADNWRFVFKIEPETIITAPDGERPALDGPSRTPVPGAGEPYVPDPTRGDGDNAEFKWDVSRQLKETIGNSQLIPKADLGWTAPYLAGQPAETTTLFGWPVGNNADAEGNDDPPSLDEKDDPYHAYGIMPLAHAVGELSSNDWPISVFIMDSCGAPGRTIVDDMDFREFCRLQIWDEERQAGRYWYRISNFEEWHVGFRAKWNAATSSWDDDDSRRSNTDTGNLHP